jgi:hypothetical protein
MTDSENPAITGHHLPGDATPSISVLGVVIATCAALFYLMYDARYDSWAREYRWHKAKVTKEVFLPITHIKDDGDRIVNDELLSTDYSHGGVYFFGTSNLEWGLKLWELPPSQAPYIHNFAINATGHTDHFRLIRFLVDNEGLLRGGAEKSLIVIGACYQNVKFAAQAENAILASYLDMRGFYARSADGSIQRSNISRLQRELIIEKVKVEGLARELAHLAILELKARLGRIRPRSLDPEGYIAFRTKLLGPDWQARIKFQVDALATLLDYLREHKIPHVVVLMPQGTWETRMPFDKAYTDDLLKVCQERGTKICDLHALLPDDDFADSNHFTPGGSERFQAAILPLCLDHLHSNGLGGISTGGRQE